jgi:hypothetical protein
MFKQGNRRKGVAVANNNNNQTAESSRQALYTGGRAQPSGRVKQVKEKQQMKRAEDLMGQANRANRIIVKHKT